MSFLERYNKAKTLGQLDTILKNNLKPEERELLLDALEIVETYLDITFRDKAVKRALKHFVEQDKLTITDSELDQYFRVK